MKHNISLLLLPSIVVLDASFQTKTAKCNYNAVLTYEELLNEGCCYCTTQRVIYMWRRLDKAEGCEI